MCKKGILIDRSNIISCNKIQARLIHLEDIALKIDEQSDQVKIENITKYKPIELNVYQDLFNHIFHHMDILTNGSGTFSLENYEYISKQEDYKPDVDMKQTATSNTIDDIKSFVKNQTTNIISRFSIVDWILIVAGVLAVVLIGIYCPCVFQLIWLPIKLTNKMIQKCTQKINATYL